MPLTLVLLPEAPTVTASLQPGLDVHYFDGQRATAVQARMRVDAGTLRIENGEQMLLHAQPLQGLQWPERVQWSRILQLNKGASVQALDAHDWDRFAAQFAGKKDSWVERLQANWQAAVAAWLLLVAGGVAAYVWGIPAAGKASLAFISMDAERRIGDESLRSLERLWCNPSKLSPSEQQRWRDLIQAHVKKAYPNGNAPAFELHFYALGQPNAFAMPGGHIAVSDELIQMAKKHPDVADAMVLGVFGHELGHVRHRHGMQHLVSSSVLGAVSAFLMGDFSAMAAAGAAGLGQAKYSRDKEREADAYARAFLHASGTSPLGMVRFFSAVRDDRRSMALQACLDNSQTSLRAIRRSAGSLEEPSIDDIKTHAKECQAQVEGRHAERSKDDGGMGFASHPAPRERVKFLEEKPDSVAMP